jgi:tRNA-dihydrouridine synthase C
VGAPLVRFPPARAMSTRNAYPVDLSPAAAPPPPLDHLAVMRRWRDWRRGRTHDAVPPPPAPLLLLAPMESLADRPMRVALARLQRRAAAALQPADPRRDPPAVVAASRALLCGGASSPSSPGFDEACQEFIRVPGKLPPGGRAHAVAKGVCRAFSRAELDGATPLAAQLMGSEPLLMAESARHLALSPAAATTTATPRARGGGGGGRGGLGGASGGRGARSISLNCGCPANTVTGHGAGSSLLREPARLAVLVASMSEALAEVRRGEEEEQMEVHQRQQQRQQQQRALGSPPPPRPALPPIPPPVLFSVKVRAGFDDASLFEANALAAARDGGCGALVVHPRTKRQAYRGRADWRLIHRAVELLQHDDDDLDGATTLTTTTPVIGNGDVVRAADALAMALATGCSGVMVGRGAIQDPLIFLRVRAAFAALAHLRGEAGRGGGRGASRRGGAGAEEEEEELLVRRGNGGDGDAARASRLVVEASAAAIAAVRFSGGPRAEAALVESFLREYVYLADAETRRRRGGGRGSAGRAAEEEEEEEGEAAAAGAHGEAAGGNNERGRLGRLKSVLKYLFTGQPRLRAALEPILRVAPAEGASDAVLERACLAVREHWRDGGLDAATPLVSHMGQQQQQQGGVLAA